MKRMRKEKAAWSRQGREGMAEGVPGRPGHPGEAWAPQALLRLGAGLLGRCAGTVLLPGAATRVVTCLQGPPGHTIMTCNSLSFFFLNLFLWFCCFFVPGEEGGMSLLSRNKMSSSYSCSCRSSAQCCFVYLPCEVCEKRTKNTK